MAIGEGAFVDKQALLRATYRAFNAREMETVLAMLSPDVDWPNGMEGGRVHGRDEVRAYWTRQWAVVDPHVEPVGFADAEDGRTIVDVHQVIRDTGGTLLLDRMVQHVYAIEDGLITNMEIRE